jgi:hypothetical protein
LPHRSPLALAGALGTAGLLALTATAGAAVQTDVTARQAAARSCLDAPAPGAAGVVTKRFTAAETGLVRARVAGGGDWDVAVFDRAGRAVAAAAGAGGRELAEGFASAGEALTVQACRVGGGDATAELDARVIAIAEPTDDGPTQVVDVTTPDRAAKQRLQALGLDLTEHGDADSVEVVLHGADDAQTLRAARFDFEVEIADLEARGEANRERDARFARQVAASDLPSGRDSYRRLADYEAELKALAARYPTLTRLIALPNETVEGRTVWGIEITRNAQQVDDGKPIFLQMGVHHAREWPSSEHAMEFAYDLLTTRASTRTRRLLETTRTIVVPVVNPDGFTISREAAGNPNRPTPFSLFDYEMKRKNCRISANTPERFRTGTCADNPAGAQRGTDPNRNYGGFWGGPGASTIWSSATYRGDGPFSEPEVQNVRFLQSTRNITNLISNHTYSNLVLRPPGVYDAGLPLEEPVYRALGQRMTDRNGYANQLSFQLYDTTGGTEDWTFWTAGSFGFTFEIGPNEFHPPFATGVVDEYLGRGAVAGAGRGGNREAYYQMLEATADRNLHSVVRGRAAAGWKLTLAKSFTTTTHDPKFLDDAGERTAPPEQFEDRLSYRLDTRGGMFEWHLNPSTRPLVAGRFGRAPLAPTQPNQTVANPDGVPAANTGDPVTGANEVVPFTIGGLPEYDNASVTFHIEWADRAADWDVYILDAAGKVVGQSASGGTTREDARLLDAPAGEYRAVIVNYAGGATSDWSGGEVRFAGPQPRIETGVKEAYQLTCTREGEERITRQVVVDRGQTVDIGNACQPAQK